MVMNNVYLSVFLSVLYVQSAEVWYPIVAKYQGFWIETVITFVMTQ